MNQRTALLSRHETFKNKTELLVLRSQIELLGKIPSKCVKPLEPESLSVSLFFIPPRQICVLSPY